MQRIPPALLASYRALYVILRGDAADEEEEINRYRKLCYTRHTFKRFRSNGCGFQLEMFVCPTNTVLTR